MFYIIGRIKGEIRSTVIRTEIITGAEATKIEITGEDDNSQIGNGITKVRTSTTGIATAATK